METPICEAKVSKKKALSRLFLILYTIFPNAPYLEVFPHL